MKTTAKAVAVTNSLRPTLAEMRAANASRSPNAPKGAEPLGVRVGRSLSNLPKFFEAVGTSYTYHRNLDE